VLGFHGRHGIEVAIRLSVTVVGERLGGRACLVTGSRELSVRLHALHEDCA
jgi:hypothetical protein